MTGQNREVDNTDIDTSIEIDYSRFSKYFFYYTDDFKTLSTINNYKITSFAKMNELTYDIAYNCDKVNNSTYDITHNFIKFESLEKLEHFVDKLCTELGYTMQFAKDNMYNIHIEHGYDTNTAYMLDYEIPLHKACFDNYNMNKNNEKYKINIYRNIKNNLFHAVNYCIASTKFINGLIFTESNIYFMKNLSYFTLGHIYLKYMVLEPQHLATYFQMVQKYIK